MIDDRTAATMAYLDVAQPKGEPWTYADARDWLEISNDREAQALRAAFERIHL